MQDNFNFHSSSGILFLRHNNITKVSISQEFSPNAGKISLDIANNPIKCDDEFHKLLKYVAEDPTEKKFNFAIYKRDLFCFDWKTNKMLNVTDSIY